MRKISTANVIALLGVGVALLTALIGLSALYDLNERGDTAPKRLEARYYGAVDPLSDLTSVDSRLSISVRHGDAEVQNLRVVQAYLTNVGEAPIVPQDIVDPIRITSRGPWRIVNVVNSGTSGSSVHFEWERASDREYRARPTLLNPGDMVGATVYLTSVVTPPPGTSRQNPPIVWNTRIVNLRRIEIAPDPFEEMSRRIGPIYIVLGLHSIILIVSSFAIYVWLTAILLDRAGAIKPGQPASYLWLVPASIINLSASEAGSTYVFGADPTVSFLPTNHLLNAPPLIANAVMLIWLYLYSRHKRGRDLRGS